MHQVGLQKRLALKQRRHRSPATTWPPRQTARRPRLLAPAPSSQQRHAKAKHASCHVVIVTRILSAMLEQRQHQHSTNQLVLKQAVALLLRLSPAQPFHHVPIISLSSLIHHTTLSFSHSIFEMLHFRRQLPLPKHRHKQRRTDKPRPRSSPSATPATRAPAARRTPLAPSRPIKLATFRRPCILASSSSCSFATLAPHSSQKICVCVSGTNSSSIRQAPPARGDKRIR